MAIVLPEIFTPIHTEELDKDSPSNEQSLLKIVQNLVY